MTHEMVHIATASGGRLCKSGGCLRQVSAQLAVAGSGFVGSAARTAGGLHNRIEHRRCHQGAALAGDSNGGAAVARMTSRPAPQCVEVGRTLSIGEARPHFLNGSLDPVLPILTI